MVSGHSHHSAMSFHSRHNRHKRGKSRIVSRTDLYQRAMESEAYIPVEKYKIDASTRKRVEIEDNSSNFESGLKDPVDDILPEHAADAVSLGRKDAIFSLRSILNLNNLFPTE